MASRLVEYLVTVGLGDELEPWKSPMEDTISPVTDIMIVGPRDRIPDNYERLDETIHGRNANMNKRHVGFGSYGYYLCFSRSKGCPPITDILIMAPQLGERLPVGYTQMQQNLNRYSEGLELYMCYTREAMQPPILDLAFISESDKEHCPVGYEKVNRSVNEGCTFSNFMYLCFLKGADTAFDVRYKPVILDRFPLVDHLDLPLRNAVATFCMPEGLELRKEITMPTYLSFVLTSSDGTRLYGCCVTFYEPIRPELVEQRSQELKEELKNAYYYVPLFDTDPSSIYVPKCICLLSRWSYFDSFKTFLTELYRISIAPTRLPIERYISNLWEAPLPRTSRVSVHLHISDKKCVFSRPPADDFPLLDLKLDLLFGCLSLDVILIVMNSLLLEKKVILHSERLSLLTPIAEALLSLMFPLQWQFTFIPVLPRTIFGLMDAPMPLFISFHSSHVRRRTVSKNFVVCDLDNNEISLPSDHVSIPFPIEAVRQLRADLNRYSSQSKVQRFSKTFMANVDSAYAHVTPVMVESDGEPKQFYDRACRASFIHFMVNILGHDFGKYLLFPMNIATHSLAHIFNKRDYLSNAPRGNRKFLRALAETQGFVRLMEEITFSSDRDAELTYWEKCCVYERELLAAAELQKSVNAPGLVPHLAERRFIYHTYVVPPVDDFGLTTDALFSYPMFPHLDPALFRPPRPLDIQNLKPDDDGKATNDPRLYRKHSLRQFTDAFMGSSSKITKSPRHPDHISSNGTSSRSFHDRKEWANHLLQAIYGCWFMLQMVIIDVHPNPRQVMSNAFRLLDHLLAEEKDTFRPDELIFRCVLVICGKHQRKTEALRIFETMKKFSIQPSTVTYNAYAAAIADGPASPIVIPPEIAIQHYRGSHSFPLEIPPLGSMRVPTLVTVEEREAEGVLEVQNEYYVKPELALSLSSSSGGHEGEPSPLGSRAPSVFGRPLSPSGAFLDISRSENNPPAAPCDPSSNGLTSSVTSETSWITEDGFASLDDIELKTQPSETVESTSDLLAHEPTSHSLDQSINHAPSSHRPLQETSTDGLLVSSDLAKPISNHSSESHTSASSLNLENDSSDGLKYARTVVDGIVVSSVETRPSLLAERTSSNALKNANSPQSVPTHRINGVDTSSLRVSVNRAQSQPLSGLLPGPPPRKRKSNVESQIKASNLIDFSTPEVGQSPTVTSPTEDQTNLPVKTPEDSTSLMFDSFLRKKYKLPGSPQSEPHLKQPMLTRTRSHSANVVSDKSTVKRRPSSQDAHWRELLSAKYCSPAGPATVVPPWDVRSPRSRALSSHTPLTLSRAHILQSAASSRSDGGVVIAPNSAVSNSSWPSFDPADEKNTPWVAHARRSLSVSSARGNLLPPTSPARPAGPGAEPKSADAVKLGETNGRTRSPSVASNASTDGDPVPSIVWSELYMSSWERCPTCKARLLDAEIMAGWGEDPHKYVSLCQSCQKREFVPNLRIRFRCTEASERDPDAQQSVPPTMTDFNCPYLCPLVLRKEVETAINSFRSDLQNPHRFRHKHSTVFWNLLWYFEHRGLNMDCLVGSEQAESVRIHPILGDIQGSDTTCIAPSHRDPDISKKLAEIVTAIEHHKLDHAIRLWTMYRSEVPVDQRDASFWSTSIFIGLQDLGAAVYYDSRADFIHAFLSTVANLSASTKDMLLLIDNAPSRTVAALQDAFKNHPRTFHDLR
eukprot:71769_1